MIAVIGVYHLGRIHLREQRGLRRLAYADDLLCQAVSPVGRSWNFDLVLETVREAFALARLRAVAPETLSEYGHHLPAVYLSSNLDTIGASNGV